MFDRIKSLIAWSWTYLWAVWFILVVFVIIILRGPLKISENVAYGMLFGSAPLPSIRYPDPLQYSQ
jgi:hypothetical protein